jgi:hypothetical protein
MDQQNKLKEEQRKLTEGQRKLRVRIHSLSEELGRYDVRVRTKDFSDDQTKFREDQGRFLKEEKSFWVEQRRRGRFYGNYFRGDGNANDYSGNNSNGGGYARGNGNGNGGYARGVSNGHHYNYRRGGGNGDQQYNYNGGYSQNNYYFGPYQQEYGDGEFYHGERQNDASGKARRQTWQRKDRAVVSNAYTDAGHKPGEKLVSASEMEQNASSACNDAAVPVSGSEHSTG